QVVGVLDDVVARELLTQRESLNAPDLGFFELIGLDAGEADVQTGIVESLTRAEPLEQIDGAADERKADGDLIEGDVRVPKVVGVERAQVGGGFATPLEDFQGLLEEKLRGIETALVKLQVRERVQACREELRQIEVATLLEGRASIKDGLRIVPAFFVRVSRDVCSECPVVAFRISEEDRFQVGEIEVLPVHLEQRRRSVTGEEVFELPVLPAPRERKPVVIDRERALVVSG